MNIRCQYISEKRGVMLAGLLLFTPLAQAQTVVHSERAILLLKEGVIEIERPGGERRTVSNRSISEGEEADLKVIDLKAGELIRTSKETFCDVMIPSVGSMRVMPESEMRLPEKPEANRRKQHSMELLKGQLFMDIDAVRLQRTERKQFRLKTPTTVLAVRGTRLFAQTRDGIDTAGVHKGNIAVLETSSGKTMPLSAGRAVAAKPGRFAAPRTLTEEERGYSDYYDLFTATEIPAESPARKAMGEYRYIRQKNTAIYDDDKSKFKLEKIVVPGVEGKVLRYTFEPNTDFPDGTTRANVLVTLSKKVPGEPIGIRFAVRHKGLVRLGCRGVVAEFNKKNYGINRMNIELPKDLPPDQWFPVFIPLTTNVEVDGWNNLSGQMIELSADPNMHEKRAVPSIVQVVPGLPEYQYEISPITIVSRTEE